VAARGEVKEWWIGAAIAADVVLLTALLYLSGGPLNPFSFLYLVEIALAAVILPARWTWALVVLSLLGSALLFVASRPLPLGADHMTIHLRGMWVAFGVAAAFIVYFLLRVRRSLEAREADLAAMRNLAARQEKLAALATLAAGAAHELSTPLSTIAVVAKELERQISHADALEDVRLIREEVARCRSILQHMAAEPAGENLVELSVKELLKSSLESIRETPPVRVDIAGEMRLQLPRRAVAQAIGSIVRNAQDASSSEVVIQATPADKELRIEVRDQGAGMPPEVLARAGEPFFTTKEPGRGMGLGLFLSRAVVERLGGALTIASQPGSGTVACVRLPAKP
jgi:two-component system sensor histidine kinase RegB